MNSCDLIGKPAAEVDTPSLLLDIDALKANIDTMAAFFADKPSRLRPHFKSRKCTAIAKLGEAEVFAENPEPGQVGER